MTHSRVHSRLTGLAALAALAVLGLAACDRAPQAERPAAQAESGTHAPANVVPGSYEDWCGEHEVPESQCTRCNPTLAAAFQATGDWCSEHGLPESQCRVCNPALEIRRPPKPGATP